MDSSFSESIRTNVPKTSNIKCANCGVEFNPGLSNTTMCIQCVTEETIINIDHDQGEIFFCRYCKRYNKPPYIYCERESKELLSLCLKRIKELNHFKLNDATFIWTEPHSRRIRLRLTLQQEVKPNTFVQKSIQVEFTESEAICEDCKKEFTPHKWTASVQVRQKIEHKRTFFYLEQMILKNNANERCLKIKEEKDGLDFFFKNKADATKFLEFIQGIIAMAPVKPSKQLISQNDNEYNYKYNFLVEIPRICKDDLVIIPHKMRNILGGCNEILLCLKVSNHLHMLDPISFKTFDISAAQYFQFDKEITTIPLKKNSTEFMVLNIKEELPKKSKKPVIELKNQEKIFEIEIARVSDWETFTVKSHLGNILKENSAVQGFDLSRINFFLVEEISITKNLEIILVKKVEEKTKKSGKKKKNTKRLDIEGINENNIHKKSAYQEEKDKDYEEFLEELEDEENHTENSKAQEKQKDENIDVFNEKKENNNEKAVNVENTEENKEVSNEKKEKTNEKAENNLKNEG